MLDKDIEFEINVNGVPFENGEAYIVGMDTMGNGLVFNRDTEVCLNIEDLNNEVHRVISDFDLSPDNPGLPLHEVVVIAKLIDNYNIDYSEYEVTRKLIKRKVSH